MSLFQNIHVFMIFYLTIVGFPFAIAAVHTALDALEKIRSVGRRPAVAAVAPVAATV